MNVNVIEINRIINLKCDECIDYKIEVNDTRDFVENLINEYYDRIYFDLIDHSYDDELRKEMFKELLNIVKNEDCILYQNINNCINNIKNESICENMVINDIFKLQ